jgi:hypothetical protein
MKRQFRFKTPGKLIDAELQLGLVEKRPADPKRNRSSCYVFEMRKRPGTTRIGTIRLRIDSTNTLRLPGHLGFDVKTRYRGHRYAARSCRLLLPLAAHTASNPFGSRAIQKMLLHDALVSLLEQAMSRRFAFLKTTKCTEKPSALCGATD